MPPSKRPKTSYNARTKSATTLKKKIRDAERLLQRPISADVRVESERALAAFKHELTIATRARTEQKIAKKYHMVRFFERQKATRRLNKLRKELAMYEGGGGEDLRKKAHDASVELNYTLHYPRGERYISLFKDPGSNTDAIEKRDMIKKDIERRMEKGTLGARTTDPVEQDEEVKEEEEDEDRKTTKKVKSKSTKENKIKRKVEPEKVKAETIENDGFFEF